MQWYALTINACRISFIVQLYVFTEILLLIFLELGKTERRQYETKIYTGAFADNHEGINIMRQWLHGCENESRILVGCFVRKALLLCCRKQSNSEFK